MGFDFELKYTPGDALSRLDSDNVDDNDRVCFALDNIYFVQSDLVTQSEVKTELGSKAASGNSAQKQRKDLNNRKTP